MADDKATLLADLLVQNDLRGVFSHGSRQVATYARDVRDGKLNARPQVTVRDESAATLLLDGDGGLGYFPSWQGAQALVEKARNVGVGVAVTRNHGHFGAAGLYTRVAVGGRPDRLRHLRAPAEAAAGAAPPRGGGRLAHELRRPRGRRAPLVLDFGAIHDLYGATPELLAYMMESLPSTLFRSLGLGAMCQVLGGFLAGVPLDESRARQPLLRRQPGGAVRLHRSPRASSTRTTCAGSWTSTSGRWAPCSPSRAPGTGRPCPGAWSGSGSRSGRRRGCRWAAGTGPS